MANILKFDRLYLETEQNTIINAKRGCWVSTNMEECTMDIYYTQASLDEEDPEIGVDPEQIVWLEYSHDGNDNDHEDEIRRAEFWALFEETE
jgi:hypothetical protein